MSSLHHYGAHFIDDTDRGVDQSAGNCVCSQPVARSRSQSPALLAAQYTVLEASRSPSLALRPRAAYTTGRRVLAPLVSPRPKLSSPRARPSLLVWDSLLLGGILNHSCVLRRTTFGLESSKVLLLFDFLGQREAAKRQRSLKELSLCLSRGQTKTLEKTHSPMGRRKTNLKCLLCHSCEAQCLLSLLSAPHPFMV